MSYGALRWLWTPLQTLSAPLYVYDAERATAPPARIQTLYYGPGRMERTFEVHMSRNAAPGDYVPGLYRRRDADCLTAVNWNTRQLVFQNRVLVIDFWDQRQKRWERRRCQASDWQQKRHSTGSRQRFEIDYRTAVSLNMLCCNTVGIWRWTE